MRKKQIVVLKSVAIEAYLGETCHLLWEDWIIESHSQTTMPLEESHLEWLEDVIANFPPERVKAAIHEMVQML